MPRTLLLASRSPNTNGPFLSVQPNRSIARLMSDVILASVPCYLMLQIRSIDISATFNVEARNFYDPQPLGPRNQRLLDGHGTSTYCVEKLSRSVSPTDAKVESAEELFVLVISAACSRFASIHRSARDENDWHRAPLRHCTRSLNVLRNTVKGRKFNYKTCKLYLPLIQ